MVTTRTICLVAHIPITTLQKWMKSGVVTPVKKGKKGRGGTHQFSMMQAVGLVVAKRLMDSRRGAYPRYIEDVVRGFSLLGEVVMGTYFQGGRTHFSESFNLKGVALLDLKDTGKRYDRVDVKEVYEAILKEMSVADPVGSL